MKLQCLHADTCLPDYWGGHHLAHICVPVDCNTKITELRNMLHSELNQGAVAGNNPLAMDDSGEDGDKWFKAAHAAINRDVRLAKGSSRVIFPDIPPFDESEFIDCSCAYFVFVDG